MTEFTFQASALARKCATQQLRAVKTNVCLLLTPVLFCMTLWVLQHVVMQLILQNSNFQVGTMGKLVIIPGLCPRYIGCHECM